MKIIFNLSLFLILMGSAGIVEGGELEECRNEQNKIGGCVEWWYEENPLFGKLLVEVPYRNGKIEGIVKKYDGNRNLRIETPVKGDKAEGIVKMYYENGKLLSEIPFKNDKAEGIGKQYYENGKLKLEVLYKNGQREGIQNGYYENGKLKSEVLFKDGKGEGIAKLYYENGKLKSEFLLKDGKGEGIAKMYDENGVAFETSYKNEQEDEKWEIAYRAGVEYVVVYAVLSLIFALLYYGVKKKIKILIFVGTVLSVCVVLLYLYVAFVLPPRVTVALIGPTLSFIVGTSIIMLKRRRGRGRDKE